jgi:hypothetical protein
MKKVLAAIISVLVFSQAAHSQTGQQTGKPITEIFTDFHLNLNDTSANTGFAITRAYIGYQFMPAGNFTAKVMFNIGSPEELAAGSTAHRYPFFREASLTWTSGKLSITGGITSTRMFVFQQTFWGKRYVANTYQSLNGYGYIADIGVVAEYKFSDIVSADYTLMNGEGYGELQMDNNLKNSFGVTINPVPALAIRFYSDQIRKNKVWQVLGIAFVGYKNEHFNIGAEASYKSNADLTLGHNIWGISSTGGISVTKKTELFMRYDYSTSVRIAGSDDPWNHAKNGSFLVSGIQFTLSQNVKLALDYQGKNPYDDVKPNTGMLYVNALFKF